MLKCWAMCGLLERIVVCRLRYGYDCVGGLVDHCLLRVEVPRSST